MENLGIAGDGCYAISIIELEGLRELNAFYKLGTGREKLQVITIEGNKYIQSIGDINILNYSVRKDHFKWYDKPKIINIIGGQVVDIETQELIMIYKP